MATYKRPLHTPHDTAQLIHDIKGMMLPLRVVIREGDDRSLNQNNLAHKWYAQAANWLGDQEAWEVRAECKLFIGIRLLVTENEDFREQWGRLIKDRFTVEEKLMLMTEPHDYPVTRIMSKPQMGRYMDSVYRKYKEQGVPLSEPEMRKYEEQS